MLSLKRVYDVATPDDGFRILVDRLWPRGVKKETARVDAWFKDLAPSAELRKWFGHDPARWDGFLRRYQEELRRKAGLLAAIAARARGETVTLLYGARDREHNQAVVLKRFLETEACSEPAGRVRVR